MKERHEPIALIEHLTLTVLLLVLGAGLAACDVDAERNAEGDVEVEAEVSEEELEEAEENLEQVGEDLERAGEKLGEAVERAGERLQPYAEDAAVTARVKARLTADPDTNPLLIDVDTVDGVVTLTGKVPSREMKQEALSIAAGTEGVLEVKDNLEVGRRGEAPGD